MKKSVLVTRGASKTVFRSKIEFVGGAHAAPGAQIEEGRLKISEKFLEKLQGDRFIKRRFLRPQKETGKRDHSWKELQLFTDANVPSLKQRYTSYAEHLAQWRDNPSYDGSAIFLTRIKINKQEKMQEGPWTSRSVVKATVAARGRIAECNC